MEPAPVTRFRKYLQIKTVQPTPDYAACTEFLIEQAKEIGLEVTPNVNFLEFCQYLKDLAAKNDVKIEFLAKTTENPITEYSESDPFMASLLRTLKKHNKKPRHIIMPAATDARFVRRAGIPAVGINPMLNQKLMAHANNECIDESEYLAAIPFYEDLMIELANTL
ncbi:hypothetical protein BB561_001418 [Smittium simulii]|uniref:Peptidase M20 dimerisation domain-containing protein n=1 Tax=Smittium simulii TaxID=133385 RepID=A0A2T9YUS1_9FUNG|nr:hypothetical protein BB561_001418 [Smittium simulii]